MNLRHDHPNKRNKAMSSLPDFPRPPFPKQQQASPGKSTAMDPQPDYGEKTYKGSGRLKDKIAVITGGDSGIGRAVALAYAREGAHVLVAYLNEEQDARETRRLVEDAGRRCILFSGDIAERDVCVRLIDAAVKHFGRIDVLVNNAAHQMSFDKIEDISDEEWDRTFAVNISAMFRLTKAAVKHMKEGSSIINTASVNADSPSPHLLAYATTKGAIQNFSGGLAQLLAEKGIRVNAVAPGPVWTPLIPATMPPEKVASFGEHYPLKRPAQPCELAPVYVMLASDEASYISGATVAVTGGKPII
jgi:NAD(P)-dependent dehydrogenase (short-subunit alcohol dehydrogenase family)